MSIATQCGRLRGAEFQEDKYIITFDTVLAKKIMDAYVAVIGIDAPEADEESVHADYMSEESDNSEKDKSSDSLQPTSPDLVVLPFFHSKEKLKYDQLYDKFKFMWEEQQSPQPSDVYVKKQGYGMLFVFATPKDCGKFKYCFSSNNDIFEKLSIRICGGQKMKDFDKIGENYKRWHE